MRGENLRSPRVSRVEGSLASGPSETQYNERDYGQDIMNGQDVGQEVMSEGYASENVSYSKREVVIKPLDSGFLVNVGCQSAAVETTEKLLYTLKAYFENPNEFETQWFKNNNRNKL